MIRRGELSSAVEVLRRFVAANPKGRGGDEASLILGNALLTQKRDFDAIGPLERVVGGGVVAPGYAHVLLARAIVQAGAAEKNSVAEAALKQWTATTSASAVVREHASFLSVKLWSAQKRWADVARMASTYLSDWPRSVRADEVRWLGAEALRESGRRGEALRGYEDIWYERTQSRWAKEAGQRASELAGAGPATPRVLTSDQRYDFVKALQKVGLHEAALAELSKYDSQQGAANTDGALLLRASSFYALRKNAECIAAAEKLRAQFPSSPHVPSGAVQAIKALRRTDDEARIRTWCRFLEEKYPSNPSTTEALYNLGVFLASLGKEEEAISLLERVSRIEKANQNRDDALWKLAWADRKSGRTDSARERLRVLLREMPDSGYRKAALYWLGRFSLPAERDLAVEQFQRLMEEFPHDYYGHEAARKLSELGVSPRKVGNGKPFPPMDRLEDPNARAGEEAYALAVNLRRAGLSEFAAEELQRVPGVAKDPSLQFGLAELHAQAGETWEAWRVLERSFKPFIQSGSRDASIVPRDFWYIVYPYLYRGQIERAVKDSGLPAGSISPALMAALIRMESRFLATAVSPAGAIGLMQLLPETATKMAKERTGESIQRSELFNPEINIRYGIQFFASRVKEFSGDVGAAICSYNAGPDPVRKWWRGRPPNLEMDEFIESIPYLDTRIYIKQVLGDARNYEWIYGKTP